MLRRRLRHQTARDSLFRELFKSRHEKSVPRRNPDISDLTGKFIMSDLDNEVEPDTEPGRRRSKKRVKRDTVMPQTITGWSVMLVAVICATGIALVALKEREIALGMFGGAGWVGYVFKLIGKDK